MENKTKNYTINNYHTFTNTITNDIEQQIEPQNNLAENKFNIVNKNKTKNYIINNYDTFTDTIDNNLEEEINIVKLYADTNEIQGLARHSPPSTKEWRNSVYMFDKNNEKGISVANDTTDDLIKGYFNMRPLINKKRSRLVVRRFRRLSLNQILLSKTELKHTNNKVIITSSIYNKNKKFLLYKLKNLYKPLDNTNNRSKKNNRNNRSKKNNSNIRKKKLLLKQKNKLITTKNHLNSINGITKINNIKNYKLLPTKNLIRNNNYIKMKTKFIAVRAMKLFNRVKKHNNLLGKTLNWDNLDLLRYENKFYTNYMKQTQKIELLYMYYIKMLAVNNNKYKNWFLLGLSKTISKLYNKKVEFNFVNLRYLHLNSDIFTQSMVTKLKNRNNSIKKVLAKALILAKTPWKNDIVSYSMSVFLKNSLNSNHPRYKPFPLMEDTDTRTNTNNENSDTLDSLLVKQYIDNTSSEISLLRNPHSNTFKDKLLNILSAIRYKTVLGVRLEAAGRLSKRLTASRSIFKLKYKGGIRDTYDDVAGVSSLVIRGNNKPNIQYTLVNSKTRNGSFGLKTWINSY